LYKGAKEDVEGDAEEDAEEDQQLGVASSIKLQLPAQPKEARLRP
jgi:hypothetical protein